MSLRVGRDHPAGEGRLVLLRTKTEVEKSQTLTYIYVCEVPVRYTNEVVEMLKKIPGQPECLLSHLRRVAKAHSYPRFLRMWHTERSKDKQYLYLTNASLIPKEELMDVLSRTSLFSKIAPVILTIPVPLFPPVSQELAAQWSEQYWPVIWSHVNPFGPHPHDVAKAKSALERNDSATRWTTLALDVAQEATHSERGYPIGTVIVQKLDNGLEKVVCVASDARCGIGHQLGGDPMGHSVMRAIAMVAEKRRALARNKPNITVKDSAAPASQQSMTATEDSYLSEDNLLPDGYLCLNLHVFTTHEPCLMCSMALVHSRVGSVVFIKEMSHTGGMVVDRLPNDTPKETPVTHNLDYATPVDTKGDWNNVLRYGLFWRDDLNWRFLAWQWTPDRAHSNEAYSLPEHVHA